MSDKNEKAFSLLYENELRISLNGLEAKDPKKILEKITEKSNVFSVNDVNRFCYKHIDHDQIAEILDEFWKQKEIVPLLDPKSHKETNRFTTQTVLEEERRILRLGDALAQKNAFRVNIKKAGQWATGLNREQTQAFSTIFCGKGLTCIEGYAGTGKSVLLLDG